MKRNPVQSTVGFSGGSNSLLWFTKSQRPAQRPKNLVQVSFLGVVPKLRKGLLPCQLICTVTWPLDWAWKTTPKWPLICLIPFIGYQVTWRLASMSADLYSDLTIRLGMKNYPKMTPHMPHSAHWFQSYGKVFFHVSWFVQWPHQWIGHEKLPQNDPSYARIHPLVPKLWKGLLPCQLICTVTSSMDWSWKTTPKWPLIC